MPTHWYTLTLFWTNWRNNRLLVLGEFRVLIISQYFNHYNIVLRNENDSNRFRL